MWGRVGGGVNGGLEWRGAASVSCAGKMDRGGGGMASRRRQAADKSRKVATGVRVEAG
jgi:hypothetical protein